MSPRVRPPGPSSTAEAPPAEPPVRRRRWWAWLLLGGAGLGTIVVGAFIGYWVFMHLSFALTLQHQKMAITLPERMQVAAKVGEQLDIRMNGVINAQVPFNQELTLPLRGRYRSDVTMDAKVPVKFDVTYDGIIPVDTVADIEIRTDFNYMSAKTLRNLDIKAKLPMQFSLPVQLTAPVDQTIDLRYEGPLVMNLDQEITTEVDTVINTSLQVDQRVSAPVLATIPMTVTGPARPIRAIITESTIGGRVRDLVLEVAEDTDGPVRTESPWGPAALPIADRPVAAEREATEGRREAR